MLLCADARCHQAAQAGHPGPRAGQVLRVEDEPGSLRALKSGMHGTAQSLSLCTAAPLPVRRPPSSLANTPSPSQPLPARRLRSESSRPLGAHTPVYCMMRYMGSIEHGAGMSSHSAVLRFKRLRRVAALQARGALARTWAATQGLGMAGESSTSIGRRTARPRAPKSPASQGASSSAHRVPGRALEQLFLTRHSHKGPGPPSRRSAARAWAKRDVEEGPSGTGTIFRSGRRAGRTGACCRRPRGGCSGKPPLWPRRQRRSAGRASLEELGIGEGEHKKTGQRQVRARGVDERDGPGNQRPFSPADPSQDLNAAD